MTLAIATPNTLEARAQAWASKQDDDLKREAASAANARDPDRLWSLAEAFLATRSRGRTDTSPNTLRAYRRGILDLIDAWQHENLLRPSRNAPDLYVVKLMLKGLKPGTIAIKLASARTLYAALTWAGAVERDPFKGVKGPPDLEAPWDKRRPYTEEEVSRLLAKSRAVDRVLVLLGAHAGLRVAEAVDLLWTDVDLDARELKVRHGKGGRPRTVAVSAGLARALADLQAITSRDRVLGYTTTTRARARMRRLAFRALVPYRGVHALRHACGTRMAREKGLEAAQHHLGHQNLATTQVYAKWNQDEIRSTVGAWE